MCPSSTKIPATPLNATNAGSKKYSMKILRSVIKSYNIQGDIEVNATNHFSGPNLKHRLNVDILQGRRLRLDLVLAYKATCRAAPN